MDYIISTSSWPKKGNVSQFLNNLRVRMYTTFSCRDVHYKWQDIGGDFWVFLKWTKQMALLAITASRSISWVVFSVPSYSELVHSIISIFFVEIRIFKDFFSSNHGLYFVCCQRLFSQKWYSIESKKQPQTILNEVLDVNANTSTNICSIKSLRCRNLWAIGYMYIKCWQITLYQPVDKDWHQLLFLCTIGNV